MAATAQLLSTEPETSASSIPLGPQQSEPSTAGSHGTTHENAAAAAAAAIDNLQIATAESCSMSLLPETSFQSVLRLMQSTCHSGAGKGSFLQMLPCVDSAEDSAQSYRPASNRVDRLADVKKSPGVRPQLVSTSADHPDQGVIVEVDHPRPTVMTEWYKQKHAAGLDASVCPSQDRYILQASASACSHVLVGNMHVKSALHFCFCPVVSLQNI